MRFDPIWNPFTSNTTPEKKKERKKTARVVVELKLKMLHARDVRRILNPIETNRTSSLWSFARQRCHRHYGVNVYITRTREGNNLTILDARSTNLQTHFRNKNVDGKSSVVQCICTERTIYDLARLSMSSCFRKSTYFDVQININDFSPPVSLTDDLVRRIG